MLGCRVCASPVPYGIGRCHTCTAYAMARNGHVVHAAPAPCTWCAKAAGHTVRKGTPAFGRVCGPCRKAHRVATRVRMLANAT